MLEWLVNNGMRATAQAIDRAVAIVGAFLFVQCNGRLI
jgi:hypothetical protein